METEHLIASHLAEWHAATRHPFLDAVRDGTLPPDAFHTWLVQDYRFVGDLLRFQARLLARAPRRAQPVLAGGLVALVSELGWFESQAQQRGLRLDAPAHPVAAAYGELLARLEHQPFAVGITALWALERAYLEAWQHAAPGAPAFRPFVEHWTVPEFAAYVAGLADAANEALAAAEDAGGLAEQAFLEVTRLERDFWQMAWEAAPPALPATTAASEVLAPAPGLTSGSGRPGTQAGPAAPGVMPPEPFAGTAPAPELAMGRPPPAHRHQMGLAARLWLAEQELAQQALEHPFVRALGEGTLDRERFKRYIAQDAFFLEAFARAYALALARSADREGMAAFFELLKGALDELDLHRGYAQQWQIDLAAVEPAQATLAYTDFLLATAALGSLGEVCAAMVPCMRLYAFLGQSLLAARGDRLERHPYAEWIRTYSSQEFEGLAERLEALLDRYAHDTPPVRGAYHRAMRLEVAFFEAAFAAPAETTG